MKKSTSMAWAMARRTRTSASSLRRVLNSSVLLKAFASMPRFDTSKRLSLLQPVEIGERQAIIGAELDLARLERRGSRGLVGDDAPDDAVEIGILLAPVVRVALGDDELAALVLDELERSRADRRGVGRVLEDVRALEDVARRDVAEVAKSAQQQVQRHRTRIAEHRRMGIGRIDRLEILLELGAVVEMLLPHLHGGVLDIGRGERLAVVPVHALAQLEGDRLPVGRSLPAGGKHPDRAALGVEIDQRLHDLAGDDVDERRGPERRIEDALLGTEMRGQHATPLRRFLLCPAWLGQECSKSGGARRKQGFATGEAHLINPFQERSANVTHWNKGVNVQ